MASKPRKLGNSEGLDVHKTIREGLDQHRGDNPHPASHHHRIHPVGLEGADQLGIQLLPAGQHAMVQQGMGNLEPLCTFDGTTVGIVHDQPCQLSVQPSRVDGLGERLEIAAVS